MAHSPHKMRTPRGRTFKRVLLGFTAPPWWWLISEDRKNYRYADSLQFVISDCLHAALFQYGLPVVQLEQLDRELKRTKLPLNAYLQNFFLKVADGLSSKATVKSLTPRHEGVVRVQLSLPEELYKAYHAWQKQKGIDSPSESVARLIEPVITFYDVPLFALAKLRADMASQNLSTVIYSRELLARHLFELGRTDDVAPAASARKR